MRLIRNIGIQATWVDPETRSVVASPLRRDSSKVVSLR